MKIDNGLRPLFREYLRAGIMWTSIETGATAGGVPDSNYLSDTGIEGWIEFKATKKNSVTFRTDQIGHIRRRVRYGGRMWIAVRYAHSGGPRLGTPTDQLWLYPGSEVSNLLTGGMAAASGELCGENGPPRWYWDRVRWLLLA